MKDKIGRDVSRLISCIKKSKTKRMNCEKNYHKFWYFPDVNQTGWLRETIQDAVNLGLISAVEESGTILISIKR